MRSPFDLPTYGIRLGKRYQLRGDAEAMAPQVPRLVEVTSLPTGRGNVEFHDVAHPSSAFVLLTGDFREIYDPAQ